MTVGWTGAFDLGAAGMLLIGWPARSANVALLLAGSGTGTGVSLPRVSILSFTNSSILVFYARERSEVAWHFVNCALRH